ncbi:TraR/DksA family transcriptional regulator [Longispora urticae]
MDRTKLRNTRTAELRAGLLARHGELSAAYRTAVREAAERQRHRLADVSGDDEGDRGLKAQEREQDLALVDTARQRMAQVNEALDRLDAGGYGLCERCGAPIPPDRLLAFPAATHCVTCASAADARH